MVGNRFSEKYMYLSLKFLKCNNSTGSCKDPTSFLASTRVSVVYTKSLFNSSNINEPIATVLSDNQLQTFMPGYHRSMEILV
jgi:hypothetical protein